MRSQFKSTTMPPAPTQLHSLRYKQLDGRRSWRDSIIRTFKAILSLEICYCNWPVVVVVVASFEHNTHNNNNCIVHGSRLYLSTQQPAQAHCQPEEPGQTRQTRPGPCCRVGLSVVARSVVWSPSIDEQVAVGSK